MSKLKTETRRKIRDKALEMFNERGIEYVGLRELAAILDMRVSNITYYFPTKDDLVYEITMRTNRWPILHEPDQFVKSLVESLNIFVVYAIIFATYFHLRPHCSSLRIILIK